ncbi:tyrosine-type recombinase/integrase [Variovorax sp. IB41]|uniref:tyrosine-type recombinase/integrase n=1 Tax=Variovorax sp. IB41 TaxID=2779370 RepID=UPI0018E75533|nr:tyrosine-type recombinase/integrase [Variovorax sp. IB41]MBJ2158441.1 tyrosine-type recombinase/integrase [Variovorax sp. IB41]
MSNLLLPLRNALTEAVADEVIAFNPLDRLKLSRILPRDTLETDYEPDPYQWNEFLTLLCSMEGTKRCAFQFWAFTGLPTSELIALTWADLDLVAMTARIDKAVVEGEEKGTKTKSGTRTIPLLTAARQALHAQKALNGPTTGRILLNPRTGGEWTDQALLRLWQRTCQGRQGALSQPRTRCGTRSRATC